MLTRKTLTVSMILAILILIISTAFVFGFLAGKIHLDKQLATENQTEKSALTQELEKFYPPLPEKITRLTGEIISIGDNSFQIKANVKLRRLPEEGQPMSEEQIKTVTVVAATKIFKIDTKGKIVAGQGAPLKNLSFSDLEVGQQVACESVDDFDLKNVDSFTAKSVEVVF